MGQRTHFLVISSARLPTSRRMTTSILLGITPIRWMAELPTPHTGSLQPLRPLATLRRLRLFQNALTGCVPPWLAAEWSGLQEVDLHANLFGNGCSDVASAGHAALTQRYAAGELQLLDLRFNNISCQTSMDVSGNSICSTFLHNDA